MKTRTEEFEELVDEVESLKSTYLTIRKLYVAKKRILKEWQDNIRDNYFDPSNQELKDMTSLKNAILYYINFGCGNRPFTANDVYEYLKQNGYVVNGKTPLGSIGSRLLGIQKMGNIVLRKKINGRFYYNRIEHKLYINDI